MSRNSFLAIFIVCLCGTMIFANDGNSQSSRLHEMYINIEEETTSLKKVFETIERQTGFEFSYFKSVLKNDKLNLQLSAQENLGILLNKISEASKLSFKRVNDKIYISKHGKDTEPVVEEINVRDVDINGKITDENGEGLPGASVVVKGTTKGTTSDIEGNYKLNAPEGATITVSFVGYTTLELTIGTQSVIDIQMVLDAGQLEEVVVVGYASQTRAELTGSVSSVDLTEAKKQPIVNAAEALEGRVAGVTIINNAAPGGAPIVRVRGYGTPNNNDPLYIIDGVQTLDGTILNEINPEDITQFNVLKDGAASIYGARASNGVIIVTTKSGKYNQSQPSIALSAYTGISRGLNFPELLNSRQLGDVLFQSIRNDGNTPSHTQFGSGPNPVVPNKLIGTPIPVSASPGTKWFDEMFIAAPTQNVSLTFSNGTKLGRYSLSASYLNRQGILLNSEFQRAQVRFNSEFKVAERITFGEHLSVSFSHSRDTQGSNTLQGAFRTNPLIPVYDDNGGFAGSYTSGLQLGNFANPLAELIRREDDFFRRMRIFGDVYGTMDIVEGLDFKSSIGFNIGGLNSREFLPKAPELTTPRTSNLLTEQASQVFNWVFTNTLNYNKTVGNHDFSLIMGIEAVKERERRFKISLSDFLNESADFYLLDNGFGDLFADADGTFERQNTLFSLFASLNYSYGDKYLFTTTIRKDESSRFRGKNVDGIFSSVSAGWIVSNEDFFPQDGPIKRLKLKASFGQLGNQTLPPGLLTANVASASAGAANYPLGGALAPGFIVSSLGNPNLSWERAVNRNIGVEINLFDKLNFLAEYFNNETQDLLGANTNVASNTAIDAKAPIANSGNVTNKGFEFTLGYKNETVGGFFYAVNATMSTYKNEVTSLFTNFVPGNGFAFVGTPFNRTIVGHPISSFYGREVLGIFKSEEEVASAPSQGFDDIANGVGRLRYRDVNRDNIINDEDRTFIGSPHPDFTFGLNLNATYQGWDFSMFLSGVQGNDIYNYNRIFTDFPAFFNGNRGVRVLDAFDPVANPNSNFPSLSTSIENEETTSNSFFVEDGSFIRLKNLQIGYSLPTDLIDNWGLSHLRFYISATNLFTITDYSGLDPEIRPDLPDNGEINAYTLGVDVNTLPQSQIFLLGVNLKF